MRLGHPVARVPNRFVNYLRRLRNTNSAPVSRDTAVMPVPGSISGATGVANAYIDAPIPKTTMTKSFLT